MASTSEEITASAARGKLNLKRADGLADGEDAPTPGREPPRLTVADLYTGSRKPAASNEKELFSCGATELPRAAAELLPFRDLGQYGRDVRSGNVGILGVLRALLGGLFNRLQSLSTRVLPRDLWFRDAWGEAVRSVLDQDHGRLELVISDNAF